MISKTIGLRLFRFNSEHVCEDTVRMAKRWLDIKQVKYRNYCPFIVVHKPCSAICGSIINGWSVKGNGCPLQKLIPEDMRQLVQAIYDVGIGKLVDSRVADNRSIFGGLSVG